MSGKAAEFTPYLAGRDTEELELPDAVETRPGNGVFHGFRHGFSRFFIGVRFAGFRVIVVKGAGVQVLANIGCDVACRCAFCRVDFFALEARRNIIPQFCAI